MKSLAQDHAKAFEWYEKSHEAGHTTGTCCLAMCYLAGISVFQCALRAVLPDWRGRRTRQQRLEAKARAAAWDSHTLMASEASRRTRDGAQGCRWLNVQFFALTLHYMYTLVVLTDTFTYVLCRNAGISVWACV